MQKQAPSIGRILVAAGFTLSCFGLILFLWIAFGGPMPLKAEELPDHRLLPGGDPARGRVRRPDRRRLGRQGEGGRASRRRTSGSRATTRPRPRSRSSREFAPISERRAGDPAPEDAARRDLRRAHLRAPSPADGGRRRCRSAPPRNVTDAEADGDRAESRRAARSASPRPGTPPRSTRSSTRSTRRRARRSSAGRRTQPVAINGRGLDLNDTFGNLGPFVTDASEILAVAQPPEGRAQGTGAGHRAPCSRRSRSATRSSPSAIVGAEATFGALADSDEALAESFQILPTFQRETRADARGASTTSRSNAQAARPEAPAGRQRHQPDAAERPRALAEPREPLPRPRSADQGGPQGHPGARAASSAPRACSPCSTRSRRSSATWSRRSAYLRTYRKTITDFLAVPGFGLSNTLPSRSPGQDTAARPT